MTSPIATAVVVVAFGVLAGCTSVAADAHSEEARSPTSAPTNPAPRPDAPAGAIEPFSADKKFEFPNVTEDELDEVRAAIQAIPFNYKQECMPVPGDETHYTYRGYEKRVCRLARFPRFALLMAMTPEKGYLASEIQAMRLLHEQSGGEIEVPLTGPVEKALFSLPCLSTEERENRCDAFIEPWYDHEAFAWWHDDPLPSLRAIIATLVDDPAAMVHACRGIKGWLALSLADLSIGDPQGFVGTKGDARGRIVMLDPGPVGPNAVLGGPAGLETVYLRRMLLDFGCYAAK